MASVRLEKVNKIYENGVHAVKDADLEIADKAFMVLVGPSGCGKTTTLRMIAGLEDISSGQIEIGDRIVNAVAPKDRDIAMVFQNYALYPHMTVYDNMAFALKMAKLNKSEIEQRIVKTAKILSIEQLLNRKPKQLSGGQKQRVALGRAIVRQPQVFLMDEPLSNLDAKLRVQMRAELIKLHRALNATFIYVTHDQTEAMTMATQLCVMNDGIIQQVDSPQNIYDNPVNGFVAAFIGTPPINFFDVALNRNAMTIQLNDLTLPLSAEFCTALKENPAIEDLIMAVRAEDIQLRKGLQGAVEMVEMLGSDRNVYFDFDGKQKVLRAPADCVLKRGDRFSFNVNPQRIHLFDKATDISLRHL